MNVVTLLTEAESPLLGEATFVFTDIVNSTGMAEGVGDQRWAEVLRTHNRAIRAAVRDHGGEEVAFLGDGFMLMFNDAGSAFACAVAIQQLCSQFPRRFPDAPIEVRIGLHAGTAWREGRDVYGRTVHLASRIASQAQGGEILVSAHVFELLGLRPKRYGRAREVALKGLEGTHRLFSVRPAAPVLAG